MLIQFICIILISCDDSCWESSLLRIWIQWFCYEYRWNIKIPYVEFYDQFHQVQDPSMMINHRFIQKYFFDFFSFALLFMSILLWILFELLSVLKQHATFRRDLRRNEGGWVFYWLILKLETKKYLAPIYHKFGYFWGG